MKKIKRRRKKEQAEQQQKPFFVSRKEKEAPDSVPFFQAKMEIDGPDHPAEKEADKVADQVVANSQHSIQQKEEGLHQQISRKGEEEEAQTKLQRQEEEEAQAKLQRQEEEEESMQMKLQRQEEEEAQAKLQRQEEEEAQAKANNGVPKIQPSTRLGIEQQKGKGQALPEHSLREMNQAFGTDFKDVNIHTDEQAKKLAESVNAKAFTTGKDVFFNKDQFNPNSLEGKHLLAHELTHVVQQQKPKDQP